MVDVLSVEGFWTTTA